MRNEECRVLRTAIINIHKKCIVDKTTKYVTIANGTFVPLGVILYGRRLALSLFERVFALSDSRG